MMLDAGGQELFAIAHRLGLTVEAVLTMPASEVDGWRAYLGKLDKGR